MTIDRVVVDTSVLLEYLISATGPAARFIRLVFKQEIELIFSVETYDELASVVMRPKFDRYVSIETRREIVDLFLPGQFVQISNLPMGCRDPNDDKFLETAVRGQADLLVSRDRDLLVMEAFSGIPICTPEDALARMEDNPNESS